MNNLLNFEADKTSILIQLFPFMLFICVKKELLCVTLGVICFTLDFSIAYDQTIFD